MKASVLISSVLLLSSLIFISCESNKNNNIRLSTKHVEMMPDEDSAIIFAEGTNWWINDVNADGKRLYALPEDLEKDYTGIEGDWFAVEKQGSEKLIVKVSENRSKNDRKIVITLESGNYFDYISVLQKGKK